MKLNLSQAECAIESSQDNLWFQIPFRTLDDQRREMEELTWVRIDEVWSTNSDVKEFTDERYQ